MILLGDLPAVAVVTKLSKY